MKNKPVYSIDSVDHALQLAVLLQQEGPLRVADAAERLGVARSTAHRLLAMLVYRDFAVQDEDRRYVPGQVLRSLPGGSHADLRKIARPHLADLVLRTGETANLSVLIGTEVKFVATHECSELLRVGDREGRLLPAHLTSGGRVLLAALAPDDLEQRYAEVDVDLAVLRRQLNRIRRQGFAINDQLTETGVTAVGVPVAGAGIAPVAAVSLALPTARFERRRVPEWVTILAATATNIARNSY